MKNNTKNEMKHIAILGSTGSIGTQTLKVIEEHSELFKAEVLTANNNADLLITQALKFKPNTVVIANKDLYAKVSEALYNEDIKVYAGEQAIEQVVCYPQIDVVLTAMVGYCGLRPTIAAIKSGKDIALANKETLVVAGELINKYIEEYKVAVLPVDSEHSAIFQCLIGENPNKIEKLILTASGGPFRGKSLDMLSGIKAVDALKHPTWNMGNKISIDSATMMNKGFEVIEAKYLFGIDQSKIDVVVHPQSIIHSMVQFIDGSIKAQMGMPDMCLPIQYALGFPERLSLASERLDFEIFSNLTFEKPDMSTFRCLDLAYKALDRAGNVPCVINAANEIVVDAFLKDKCKFLEMPDIIESCIVDCHYIADPSLEDLMATDTFVRELAKNKIKR